MACSSPPTMFITTHPVGNPPPTTHPHQGHRFAVLHGEDPKRPNVSFFSMKDAKGSVRGVVPLGTLHNRPCNQLLWSPQGKNILLAGLKVCFCVVVWVWVCLYLGVYIRVYSNTHSALDDTWMQLHIPFSTLAPHLPHTHTTTHPHTHNHTHTHQALNGQLTFFNADEFEVMNTAEHFLATDAEWDPTGRYVGTSVNALHTLMENGYVIWTFNGQELYKYDCGGG